MLCTGGCQTASLIRNAIESGKCNAVTIARPLIANNDLVKQFASGADRPTVPCTYCNKCLVNAVDESAGMLRRVPLPKPGSNRPAHYFPFSSRLPLALQQPLLDGKGKLVGFAYHFCAYKLPAIGKNLEYGIPPPWCGE